MQGDTPLLWATARHHYEGVHLLKTFAEAEHPIPPGFPHSRVIEEHRALPEALRLPSWSRLFAQALADSPDSFLHSGQWLFAGVRPDRTTWQFASEPLPRGGWRWPIRSVREALRDDAVDSVDWWRENDCLISLRRTAPMDDSRLKWWRKKAREGALPPILVWHVGCLDAYVIADGHLRLQAALLEECPPDFIAVSSTGAENWPLDESKQQAIVESLARTESRPRHRQMNVEQMNALLIATFDDRPYLRPRTRAWARIASDEQWLNQVEAQLRAIDRLDVLQAFADRE